VNLTVCPALGSKCPDQHHVSNSFQNVADRPDLTPVDRVTYQLALRTDFQGIQWQTTRRQSTRASRSWPAPSKKSQRHLLRSIVPIPPTLTASIKEEPAEETVASHERSRFADRVNRLQRPVINMLNEWTSRQWGDELEYLDSED
jgi:hypothetical protein